MSKERQAASSFNLVGDPVPVADAFQRYGCSLREPGEIFLDGAPLMVDSGLAVDVSMLILDLKLRVAFVRVTPYTQHAAPPPWE